MNNIPNRRQVAAIFFCLGYLTEVISTGWIMSSILYLFGLVAIYFVKVTTEVTTCEYDSDTTILRCNKCGREEVEWYNDQPGDPCQNHINEKRCKGIMIRVKKGIANNYKSNKTQTK